MQFLFPTVGHWYTECSPVDVHHWCPSLDASSVMFRGLSGVLQHHHPLTGPIGVDQALTPWSVFKQLWPHRSLLLSHSHLEVVSVGSEVLQIVLLFLSALMPKLLKGLAIEWATNPLVPDFHWQTPGSPSHLLIARDQFDVPGELPFRGFVHNSYSKFRRSWCYFLVSLRFIKHFTLCDICRTPTSVTKQPNVLLPNTLIFWSVDLLYM